MTRVRQRCDSLVVILLVALAALAPPHEARADCIAPPVFISTLAFSEGPVVLNGVPPASTTPTLALNAQVEYLFPKSVIVKVTDPNLMVTTLPYNFPDLHTVGLSAVGEYFVNTGSTTIPAGVYQFAATDPFGCTPPLTTILNSTLVAAPELGQVTITSPAVERVLSTSTPTFTWTAVTNARSYRIRIEDSGTFRTRGDIIFTSQKMTDTSYTVPAGVLTPGRRYALWVEAFDTGTSTTGQFFNARSSGIVNFSVGGPRVAVSTNQAIYTSTDTVTLTLRLQNRAAQPADTRLLLWLTPPMPGASPMNLIDGNLSMPAGFDTGTIMLVSVPASQLPTGNWAVGVRVLDQHTGVTMAQRVVGFSRGP